jgi:hypothetical protein
MAKTTKKKTGVRAKTSHGRKPRFDFGRHQTRIMAGAFALLFGAVGLYFVVSSHAATAPIVTAPVFTDAAHPYTGITKAVTLKENQKAYIYTSPLSAKVTSWGSGKPTNVGTTTSVTCTDSAGNVKLDAIHGQNIVQSETIRPIARGMLDPGAAGTYTCKLTLAAYSTAAASGMTAALYPYDTYAPELRVSLSDGDGNATWADTNADSGGNAGYTLNRNGTVLNYLNKTVPVPRAADTKSWVVVIDSMMTTCKTPTSYPPVCNGSTSTLTSSSVQSQIIIQPTKSDGSSCGASALTSSLVKATISDATHHRTMPNSVTLSGDTLRALPTACTTAKIGLQAKVTAGDYVVAHTNYNYSHALALVVR